MPTLSRNVQRIVIRQGLQADIPALISAEMGWDTDKRVLRVGDNSPTPVKIMTDKSTDSFDFTSIPLIKFGKLEFQSGAKVGGLDLDSLNNSSGIIVRSPVSGVFSRTKIVSGDGSISVTNGEGIAGNIDVRVDPTIVAAIAAAQPATVTAGATAPVSPKLGDIWYNTTTHLTYLRITDGSTQQWKDIITDPNAAVGHAASYGPTAPVSPALGDMWFNTGDDTLYIRTNNGTADVWLDVSSAGGGGGGGSGVTATAGTTAPSSPTAGDMWFNTTDDTLFIYSPVGGGTFAWIDVTTSGGSSGSSGSSTPLSWTTVTRPTSPSVGTTGYNTTLSVLETWDGTSWSTVGPAASGGGGSGPKLVVFTSSGTYTKPAGLVSAKITVVGGGGGGGLGAAGQQYGAGGASGGAAIKYALAADIAATNAVVIGAGGAAPSSNQGGTGGTTSIQLSSVLVSATGGGGGFAFNQPTYGPTLAGLPGEGSNGDLNFRGSTGQPGGAAYGTDSAQQFGVGSGGSSILGGGGTGGGYNIAFVTYPGFANSGGGGSHSQAGAAGIVIIEEYY